MSTATRSAMRSSKQLLRASGRCCAKLARIGGDEFVAVLVGVEGRSEATRRGVRLLNSLQRPFEIGEATRLECTASVGIAMFPDDGRTVAEIMSRADEMMYLSKTSGRNQVQVRKSTASPDKTATA